MALASVILGISALILGVLPVGLTQLVGVAVGLVAIIFGVIARRRASEAGSSTRRATAGLLLGTLGLLVSGVLFASCVVLMERVGGEVEKSSKGLTARLARELTDEFNRRRGSAEFHQALQGVLDRAKKQGKLNPPISPSNNKKITPKPAKSAGPARPGRDSGA